MILHIGMKSPYLLWINELRTYYHFRNTYDKYVQTYVYQMIFLVLYFSQPVLR